MRKVFVFIIVLSSLTLTISAQISTKQLPRSFKTENLMPSFQNVMILSSPDIDELLYRESQQKSLFKPHTCAVLIDVNESFFDRAEKISLSDADIYVLRIKSEGALALNFYSDDFYIPKDCELYLYNPTKSKTLGAYTQDNNSDDGLFATDYVYGEELIMEYYQPKSVKEKAKLKIQKIGYFFRDIIDFEYERHLAESEDTLIDDLPYKGYQDAGSCNVNINCSEGKNFSNVQRSVVRMLIPITNYEAAWCTGTLINNTNNDRTPYILSAAHCIEEVRNKSSFSQIEFYFNYSYSGCSNVYKEPSYSTLTGCELLAYDQKYGYGDSDYMLLKLKNSIPKSFNAYWAGWSRDCIGIPDCAGIHHPQGDVKKISTVNGKTQEIGYDENVWDYDTHVMVRWKKTSNGFGITEGGSSGSGLFNSKQELIGTLSGGESSCYVSDYNKVDWYGRFDITYNKIWKWIDPQYYGYMHFNGMDYTVGLDNEAQESIYLKVYPTVVRRELTVEINKLKEKGVITLLDRLGRTVYSYQVNENTKRLTIDVSGLNKGTYFVRLYSNKDSVIRKIIVE